jgi:N-sulfoglucosamine sulfohydrolase
MINRILGFVLLNCILSSLVIAEDRPNILLCISDDQSYAHTAANGDPVVCTPAFDRIAREGIRFTHAFCDAPTCGPSRSAILTGQHIWRLEEAGNIWSTLPKKFATYTEELEKAGYFVGYTGKGWGPGRLEPGGRTQNPAGPLFKAMSYGKGKLRYVPKPNGMSATAYAYNFADFLDKRPAEKPFCFWLGTSEPHRGYVKGSGLKSGKDPAKANVPAFLPDHPVVRNDLLDYFVEIEHFDKHVNLAIALLEKNGELDNTIIVVTSDHGMPFPRGKASLYDAGIRVPLAIRWPRGIKSPGRISNGFVNLSDLAPTFLAAAGVKVPAMMTAQSLSPVFASPSSRTKGQAYIALERHATSRKGGKGYPSRAIRNAQFLYIRNYEPDRWPAGDPDPNNCARGFPYGEIDSSPTKTLLMENGENEKFRQYHKLAFGKHPTEELYDVANDPWQLNNLAADKDYAQIRKQLSEDLQLYLIQTEDPRALGKEPLMWDFYPHYGKRVNKNWSVDKPDF